jgi:hypothetical protein
MIMETATRKIGMMVTVVSSSTTGEMIGAMRTTLMATSTTTAMAMHLLEAIDDVAMDDITLLLGWM